MADANHSRWYSANRRGGRIFSLSSLCCWVEPHSSLWGSGGVSRETRFQHPRNHFRVLPSSRLASSCRLASHSARRQAGRGPPSRIGASACERADRIEWAGLMSFRRRELRPQLSINRAPYRPASHGAGSESSPEFITPHAAPCLVSSQPIDMRHRSN